MPYECVVGLNVTDDKSYADYRKGMIPILGEYGGGFRYDFKVSEVLLNEEGRTINRVFVIYFHDENSMNEFFNNTNYKKVKKEFFENAVDASTVISAYQRDF